MHTPTEDRLELALRASNEGIWQWYAGAEAVQYSERVLGFMGCTEENAPNVFLYPEMAIHENNLSDFRSAVARVMKKHGREMFGVDCQFIRPDRTICWLRIRGACVRNEQGDMVKMAGSMIDISRRKIAELALEEERYLLRMLIESIPNNVYFKDIDSHFVMVNRATAVKMGYDQAGEIIGKTDHDIFDRRHADKSRQDEVGIMQTGVSQQESLEREIWEGQDDTWVLTTKIPWYDRKGKIRGTFGVSSDVSNLLNTQIRLSQLAGELKLRNEEYEEELRLAHEIQQALLQEEPVDLPAPDVAANYQAKFRTRYIPDSEMAGDFYEVIPISPTKRGVLICDVMGHGVRASLVVAMIRGLIEKESASASEPEWFLYGLNYGLSKILQHAGITMFATAFYGVLDVQEGELRYSCAGHPMPIVIKGNDVRVLTSKTMRRGPALGLMAEAPYSGDVLSFEDFDQMVLYTDGIYEVENIEGEQLGVSGLCKALGEFPRPADLDAVLDRMLQTASRHSAVDGYGDDVCLFGIELGSANGAH